VFREQEAPGTNRDDRGAALRERRFCKRNVRRKREREKKEKREGCKRAASKESSQT
jgi:hypothetical protein